MAVINNAPRRFETSGELHIIDGATDHEVACLNEASLAITAGMQDIHGYNDRDAIGNWLLGKKNPTMIEFSAKLAQYDSTGLLAILTNQIKASPDAEVKRYTFEMHVADYQGASAGDKIVLSDCVVVPGSVKIQTGTDFDTITGQALSKTWNPAWASY